MKVFIPKGLVAALIRRAVDTSEYQTKLKGLREKLNNTKTRIENQSNALIDADSEAAIEDIETHLGELEEEANGLDRQITHMLLLQTSEEWGVEKDQILAGLHGKKFIFRESTSYPIGRIILCPAPTSWQGPTIEITNGIELHPITFGENGDLLVHSYDPDSTQPAFDESGWLLFRHQQVASEFKEAAKTGAELDDGFYQEVVSQLCYSRHFIRNEIEADRSFMGKVLNSSATVNHCNIRKLWHKWMLGIDVKYRCDAVRNVEYELIETFINKQAGHEWCGFASLGNRTQWLKKSSNGAIASGSPRSWAGFAFMCFRSNLANDLCAALGHHPRGTGKHSNQNNMPNEEYDKLINKYRILPRYIGELRSEYPSCDKLRSYYNQKKSKLLTQDSFELRKVVEDAIPTDLRSTVQVTIGKVAARILCVAFDERMYRARLEGQSGIKLKAILTNGFYDELTAADAFADIDDAHKPKRFCQEDANIVDEMLLDEPRQVWELDSDFDYEDKATADPSTAVEQNELFQAGLSQLVAAIDHYRFKPLEKAALVCTFDLQEIGVSCDSTMMKQYAESADDAKEKILMAAYKKIARFNSGARKR